MLKQVDVNKQKWLDAVRKKKKMLQKKKMVTSCKVCGRGLDEKKKIGKKYKSSKGKPGGGNTNKNGLSYEQKKCLCELYHTKTHIKKGKRMYECITFIQNPHKNFVLLRNKSLYWYMNITNSKEQAHGCKQPDYCYLNEETKIIIILEIKSQKINGSVYEKLQTGVFKQNYYRSLFPDYKVEYVYCLCDLIFEQCGIEMEFLNDNNIKCFHADDPNYKNNIVDYILNY